MFPTLFNEYLPLVENPQAAAALARATTTGSGTSPQQTGGRVHPVAILPLHSVAARAAASSTASPSKGFTSVVIRPAFFATSVIEGHSIRDQVERGR